MNNMLSYQIKERDKPCTHMTDIYAAKMNEWKKENRSTLGTCSMAEYMRRLEIEAEKLKQATCSTSLQLFLIRKRCPEGLESYKAVPAPKDPRKSKKSTLPNSTAKTQHRAILYPFFLKYPNAKIQDTIFGMIDKYEYLPTILFFMIEDKTIVMNPDDVKDCSIRIKMPTYYIKIGVAKDHYHIHLLDHQEKEGIYCFFYSILEDINFDKFAQFFLTIKNKCSTGVDKYNNDISYFADDMLKAKLINKLKREITNGATLNSIRANINDYKKNNSILLDFVLNMEHQLRINNAKQGDIDIEKILDYSTQELNRYFLPKFSKIFPKYEYEYSSDTYSNQ